MQLPIATFCVPKNKLEKPFQKRLRWNDLHSSRYLVDWKSKWLAKGLEKSLNQAAMEVLSRKREGKRLYARAQKWSCQTCLFLDSRKPTFELLRNCFSLPSESKNGHACRKNGCPPRVHFQATNVNAISVPSGRIVRRPTRIDTSMQSVDASCTASNNSRKLPVTVSKKKELDVQGSICLAENLIRVRRNLHLWGCRINTTSSQCKQRLPFRFFLNLACTFRFGGSSKERVGIDGRGQNWLYVSFVFGFWPRSPPQGGPSCRRHRAGVGPGHSHHSNWCTGATIQEAPSNVLQHRVKGLG